MRPLATVEGHDPLGGPFHGPFPPDLRSAVPCGRPSEVWEEHGMATDETAGTPQPYSGSIQLDYIKSNLFRVIHVDGAHGGLHPGGSIIHMALFSERNAIPKTETFDVKDGVIGERTGHEGREALIREVEVDALMTISTARALRTWLDDKISAAEALAGMQKSDK